MQATSDVVRELCRRYERSRHTLDIDLIETQYPDAFMFAGADGARVAEKPAVLAALSKGRELFRTLGHTSTTLQSLDEPGWTNTTHGALGWCGALRGPRGNR